MPADSRPSSAGSSIDSQDPDVTIKRVLRREYASKNETDYTRSIHPDGTKGPWQKVEKPVAAPPAGAGPTARQLYLSRVRQIDGEPYHWCLTTCDAVNGDFYGNVYQVRGDAQDMEYRPNLVGEPVNILISDILEDYYMLVSSLTPELEATVKQVCEAEPPPQASNMKDAKENCQGWTIRVLEKLKVLDMIQQDLEFFKRLIQPVK